MSWPPAMRRRAMFAPMRPSPMIPSCILNSFEVPVDPWLRAAARPSPRVPRRSGVRRSRVGGLEDAMDGGIQPRVVLGARLLGREALDESSREARHDAVV